MAEEKPPVDPFKPAEPRIPGVSEPSAAPVPEAQGLPKAWIAGGAAGLVIVAAIVWWALRPAPATSPPASAATPQVETGASASAPAPETLGPPTGPGDVAAIEELAKPWSAKRFLFRKRLGGSVPALVVRLPGGTGRRAESYWAFSLQAPTGRCELEYITDLEKLANEYGYRARHPMVADPCDRTVYDPLQLGTVEGAWVRGEAVQGSSFRPPLSIEVRVEGNRLLATQME